MCLYICRIYVQLSPLFLNIILCHYYNEPLTLDDAPKLNCKFNLKELIYTCTCIETLMFSAPSGVKPSAVVTAVTRHILRE